MRVLAGFIMRGRLQAASFAFLMALLPMMFWLSAAAVALVTLRRGITDGLAVALWALLPAVGWAWAGQPLGLFCLVLVMAMAGILRQTRSWPGSLMVMVPIGLLIAWGIAAFYAPLMSEVIRVFQQLYGPKLGKLVAHGVNLSDDKVRLLIEISFLKSVSFVVAVTAVLSLLLGRWWQAVLYNPGGLREELNTLRFTPVTAAILVTFSLLLSFNTGVMTSAIQPFVLMPLLFAGTVLVHALVWKRGLGRIWLVLFYSVLLMVYPVVVLLACLDSSLDFRGRLERKMSD